MFVNDALSPATTLCVHTYAIDCPGAIVSDGALLTATKVYSDGAREKFEGSFLNRTDRNSPTDPGVTIFGLGVVLTTPFEVNGLTYDKLFYQLK